MVTSVLNDALAFRDQPEKLFEYLQSINLTIFDPVIKEHEPREAAQTILFILCAYSEDSPLVALKRNSKVEQEGICDYLNLPEYLRKKLITLQDNTTRRAVTAYVNEFAGPLFRSYMFLRIQYDDFELRLTNRDFIIRTIKEDKDGKETTETYDTKEHGKAVQESVRIATKLTEVEKQLKATLAYTGIEELRNYKQQNLEKKISQAANTMCVEGSSLIKQGGALQQTNQN